MTAIVALICAALLVGWAIRHRPRKSAHESHLVWAEGPSRYHHWCRCGATRYYRRAEADDALDAHFAHRELAALETAVRR